jgi:ABC-2 type transport system ATP-binding protein
MNTPADSNAAPAVETRLLTRRFGPLTAVNAVTLRVPAGSIFGLLGPNGAGKSVTIKMLTTLLTPTSGSATVAGFDIVREPTAVRAHIGYVPQLLSADGELTGYENLLIFAKLYRIPRREREGRIAEAMAFVGLTEASQTLVQHYSGGMIRRLEVAQSMVHRPQVLFLDEPTIGLDPGARRVVWEHVRSLTARFGTTVFMTTHLMEEAQEFCDLVAFLHQGVVAGIGSPAQFLAEAGPGATLDDVFIRLTGGSLERGEYADVRRTRATARRLE